MEFPFVDLIEYLGVDWTVTSMLPGKGGSMPDRLLNRNVITGLLFYLGIAPVIVAYCSLLVAIFFLVRFIRWSWLFGG